MKITSILYYGGARGKIARLGLASLFLELQDILLSTVVLLREARHANGSGTLRELIDKGFQAAGEWEQGGAGAIDWMKRCRYNSSCIVWAGVETQVSARSDLVVRDVIHLRNSLQEGKIDAGIIVVPSDHMHQYLSDRTPSLRETRRYVEEEFKEAKDYPIIVIAVEHDGACEHALRKQRRRVETPDA